jgi:rubredoxin
MKKKTHKTCVEEGTCPKCGATRLDYGASETDAGLIGYYWVCPECEASGTEWHRMGFSSHSVFDKKTKGYKSFEAKKEPIIIEVYKGCASVESNPTDNPVKIHDRDA